MEVGYRKETADQSMTIATYSIAGGFWTESGVFEGKTLIKAHTELLKQKEFSGPIAGFDSFEGLPRSMAWTFCCRIIRNRR